MVLTNIGGKVRPGSFPLHPPVSPPRPSAPSRGWLIQTEAQEGLPPACPPQPLGLERKMGPIDSLSTAKAWRVFPSALPPPRDPSII